MGRRISTWHWRWYGRHFAWVRVAAVAGVLAVGLPASALAAGRPAHARPAAACPWLDAAMPIGQRVASLVSAMTLAQKVSLMQIQPGSGAYAGYQSYIPPIPSLCLPAMVQQDDSAGVAHGMTGVTQFPAPISAAATWDTGVLRGYGAAIGAEMRGKGVNDALAPTLNLIRVPQWGRAFETLGEDPHLTTALGDAEIEGMQSQGVIADVKHYAEYNQETNRDPGQRKDNVIASERTMQETELAVFGSAVHDAHAGAVMCAFPQINGTFVCENRHLLVGVLRQQYGFKGDVRADNPTPVSSDVRAVNAGLDQARAPHLDPARLLADVRDGTVSVATINAAASAIVYPMFQMGIFNRPATGNPGTDVSTPEHVAFARTTAEQGTVLLRNTKSMLPLSTAGLRSIAVIGADARTYAESAGGGSAGVYSSHVITPLQAIRDRAGASTTVSYTQGSGPYDAFPDIPSAELTPSGGSGHGITQAIYPNATLSGAPAVTTTEPTVDLRTHSSPLPGTHPSNTWSVRWTGRLAPVTTGRYRFSLTCDRPCRLTIAGRTTIDNPKAAAYQTWHTTTGRATLTAGQRVPISVTYKHPAQGSSPVQAGAVAQLGWLPPGVTLPSITRAAAAAHAAQVAIVFAGTMQSEQFDQPSLHLSGIDDRLITAVGQANPNTIVVLNTGGPVLMPWLAGVRAVLEAWYPGQQDGNATAALLFGDADPGGKLPVTFPATSKQPLSSDPARFPGQNGKIYYSEGLNIGYRWYDAHSLTPLFPFGYGLSYTHFTLSGLRITTAAGPIDPNTRPNQALATVQATVTNTGARAGAEVAQLYLGDPAAAGEPARQLKGFQRVNLRPGSSMTVTMPLTARDLAYWNTTSNTWAISPGTYQVYLGTSAALANLPLRGSFHIG